MSQLYDRLTALKFDKVMKKVEVKLKDFPFL